MLSSLPSALATWSRYGLSAPSPSTAASATREDTSRRLVSFPIAAARTALGHQPHLPSGDSAWIDFPGPPGTIPRLSYSDVARGKFKPSDVRGKVVVVGGTAPSLQDYHSTSTSGGGLMAGPEIQAASITSALDGFPLHSAPDWLNVVGTAAGNGLTPTPCWCT